MFSKRGVNSASLEIFRAFLSSADFFQNHIFGKILSGIPSECQTDWFQIRPDIFSGLIWVQSVSKGYEQMTQESNELTKLILPVPRKSKTVLDKAGGCFRFTVRSIFIFVDNLALIFPIEGKRCDIIKDT